jgi:aryl-phospho-beta-D-glucosidase BglC (GH1 family)
MFKFRVLQFPLLCLVLISQASAQLAHTDHQQIVDGAGKPLLLRATNLGNWLVREGYMWLLRDGPQSPSEIRALVLELLGPEGAATFWRSYRENYVTREDVTLLHRAGFNAIRVPLHYNLFENDDADGFQLLDRLIAWSRAEDLYVVLDLHAAPGGQTGTNIDDSCGYPWLYQTPQEQQHLSTIWRRLATHYRHEPVVLGYDLLNEPIPHYPELTSLNSLLEPLYKNLAGELRKVDAHHILFLGGAQNGTPTFRPSASLSMRTWYTLSTNIGRQRTRVYWDNTLIFANVMMCPSGWASPGRIVISGSRSLYKRSKKTTSAGLSGRTRRWKSHRRWSALSHPLIGERLWSSQSFRAAPGTCKNA